MSIVHRDLLTGLMFTNLVLGVVAICPTFSRGDETTDSSSAQERHTATSTNGEQRDLVLVCNGQALAKIVIPDTSDKCTTRAATWLQRYIQLATGAQLPIENESLAVSGEAGAGIMISVGRTGLAAEARVARDDWKWDTARMVVRDNVLFLLGRDEAIPESHDVGLGARGTCKAVVSFLEDYCGIHWFLPGPDGERVPKEPTLAVPRDLDRTIVPVFAFSAGRNVYGADTPAAYANNFRTAIKMRNYGGHSYYKWLSASEYFEDHPEYFALIGGKRTAEGNHLCSSNPEVREILIREIRKEFDQGYDWVQLGQEDNYARCECERCESLDRYRGQMPPDWYEMYDQEGFERLQKSPCERLLLLHKAIADACLESHPDKTVHLLIYRQTLVPSEKVTGFGPNVVGEICNINPQAVVPWNGKLRAYTAYLYWFDVSLGLGMGLHTTPKQAAARIRYLRDWNFIGIYQIPETNWGLMGPVYWTIAKTMGDPDLDADQLVEKYCRGVFEDAAPAMRQFFDLLYHRDIVAVERSSAAEQHLLYYPPSLCVRLDELLRRAEAEATTERSRMWVRLTREHFDYVKHLSFLLVAYEAYRANPSAENKLELSVRHDEFDRFRQHVIDLDEDYTTRWFPGYEQFANFLTANGQDVYYVPWSKRREQVKHEGINGRVLGFAGPCLIREPFVD